MQQKQEATVSSQPASIEVLPTPKRPEALQRQPPTLSPPEEEENPISKEPALAERPAMAAPKAASSQQAVTDQKSPRETTANIMPKPKPKLRPQTEAEEGPVRESSTPAELPRPSLASKPQEQACSAYIRSTKVLHDTHRSWECLQDGQCASDCMVFHTSAIPMSSLHSVEMQESASQPDPVQTQEVVQTDEASIEVQHPAQSGKLQEEAESAGLQPATPSMQRASNGSQIEEPTSRPQEELHRPIPASRETLNKARPFRAYGKWECSCFGILEADSCI